MKANERRTYHSPLREEQVERTKKTLLDAAVALIAEDGPTELTVRAVAERAGVSAPTAYRYFPTVDSFMTALLDELEQRMRVPKYPTTLDELYEMLPQIHRALDSDPLLTRAYLRTPSAYHLRRAGRRRRRNAVKSVVEVEFPRASDVEQRAISAVCQVFTNTATWEIWRDLYGIHGEGAGELAAWAVRAIAEAARKDPTALRRATLKISQVSNADGKREGST